jgi:hypothetical protein
MINKNNIAWVILASGISIALCFWAIGKAIIPGIGIACGILIGTIATVSWIVPIAGTALTVCSGVGATYLIVKIFKQASKKPFEWLVPILAILLGVIVELCKEAYEAEPIRRIIFAGVTALLFLIGGLLWKKRKIGWCIMGTIIYFLPPLMVYGLYIQKKSLGFFEGLITIPGNIVIAITTFLVILGLTAFLAFNLEKEGYS